MRNLCDDTMLKLQSSKIFIPLNYLHLFFLIYANTTKMANMMMTIICIGMPNKWENYFICVMPVIVIMIPKIIQVIAILSLRDLMIPAIPIPNMSTPITIGNFILKFNNKNKLLSLIFNNKNKLLQRLTKYST